MFISTPSPGITAQFLRISSHPSNPKSPSKVYWSFQPSGWEKYFKLMNYVRLSWTIHPALIPFISLNWHQWSFGSYLLDLWSKYLFNSTHEARAVSVPNMIHAVLVWFDVFSWVGLEETLATLKSSSRWCDFLSWLSLWHDFLRDLLWFPGASMWNKKANRCLSGTAIRAVGSWTSWLQLLVTLEYDWNKK